MRRILLLAVALLAFAVPAHADRVSVGRVPWSKANVNALHGADLAKVAEFVNATRPKRFSAEITPNQVVDFGWAKVGGGKTDLVAAIDYAGRGFYTLWIYGHGSGNMLTIQEIRGWKMKGGLKAMLQDLNGDGMDELIVLRAVGQELAWTPTTAEAVWPEIYRPESGKYVEAISRLPGVRPGPHSVEISARYVEASRDFSKYYDRILSNIDRSISMLQQRAAQGEGDPGALAHVLVLKYKILRVLGRDPTAGLNQAYQWMNSDDPQVLQCAIATLYDIGGHEREVREARQRLPGVIARAIEARKGER
jgi:hypothetical protein